MTQARSDQFNYSFVIEGAKTRDDYIIKQYATGVLPKGTVMARDLAGSTKLVPVVAAEVANGVWPVCLLAEAVDATSGDVTGASGYILGTFADWGVLFEDATTLDTMIDLSGASGQPVATVREHLQLRGIVVVASDNTITGYENS